MKKMQSFLSSRVVLAVLAVFIFPLAASATDGPPLRTEGPDDFGYTATNEGISFSWQEIADPANELGALTDEDDECQTKPIDFDFQFYGEVKSHVIISTNGFISFSSASSEPCCDEYSNEPLPTDCGIIAPFWDDLDLDNFAGARVYYKITGEAPNRMLVVTWENVPHISDSDSRLTFQAILHEGTSDITFQYKDMIDGEGSYADGRSATVGISGGTINWSVNSGFIDTGAGVNYAIFFKSPQAVTGGGTVGVTASSGEITSIQSLPPPPGAPGGASSAFAVNVTVEDGETTTLTYTFGFPVLEWWKYGATPGNTTPHWYEFTSVLPEFPGVSQNAADWLTISGNVVTVTYQDGGPGDHDLTVNGEIVDPAAPVPAPTAAGENSGTSCFIDTLYND